MLVLSRKESEAIVIGNGAIRLTIVEVGHGKVRIGIEAPSSVRVDRAEVHERRLAAPTLPAPAVVAV